LDKLNIIGINYKDNEINAKKFIKELGNPYSKIVVDPSGVNSIELGAYGVPETLLIHNKTKTILKKYIGPLDDKKLNELKMIIKNEN
jgi:cytochrome c biogenesis protein CcmG/thiol:disulfide interchange protein DsbE